MNKRDTIQKWASRLAFFLLVAVWIVFFKTAGHFGGKSESWVALMIAWLVSLYLAMYIKMPEKPTHSAKTVDDVGYEELLRKIEVSHTIWKAEQDDYHRKVIQEHERMEKELDALMRRIPSANKKHDPTNP